MSTYRKSNNIIIDNQIYGYRRIIHVRGQHDFWFCKESTSYIESVWSDLKRLLSKIYNAVKPTNFIYFAKEYEFRKKIEHLNYQGKINQLIKIFNHIANTVGDELFSKEELEDFFKNDYEDDVLESDSSSDIEEEEEFNL